jgi:hypothetical protein
MKPEPAPTAAAVLGVTCRALRGTHKTEALARAITDAGIKWSTGRVAHLEAGRVSPTVTTLYVLARAFSSLLERPITIADLLDGEGLVSLGDSEIRLSELRSALDGRAVVDSSGSQAVAAQMQAYEAKMSTWPERLQSMDSGRLRRTTSTWHESDERAVASLGVERSRAVAEIAYLWGQSLSAQRDAVAGPDANQQRRGRVSRELMEQLKESMTDGND